jgi:hypothetical protein
LYRTALRVEPPVAPSTPETPSSSSSSSRGALVAAPHEVDERVGSERRLIRAEMASIMRETAAAAATRVDTYTTARVTSSRRVAKYLMFCTLRAIETDDESVRGAKTLQLIAGRTLMRALSGGGGGGGGGGVNENEDVNEDDGKRAMDDVLRALKPGVVVRARGRAQSNPRPGGVDVVCESVRVLVGEREGGGKTTEFPSLPDENVHWVCDVASIARMRAATLRDDDDDDEGDDEGERSYDVVGVDAEWRPVSGSPVSILQIATRSDAFLVDVAGVMAADRDENGNGNGNENAEAAAAAAAFDAFLRDLFASRHVLKLGFGLDHDLKRLRTSYPSLKSVAAVDPATAEDSERARGVGVVDVKSLALVAFPEKKVLRSRVGLAGVVASCLGCYVNKAEQCSDWERRPLSPSQARYAAADAHVLTVLFDRCVGIAPEATAAALRCVPHTGPHTTPFAWCTPILKDFSRRFFPPITPRFQSPTL